MQLRGVLFYNRSVTHYCEPGASQLIPAWHLESRAIKRCMLPAAGQTMKGLKPFCRRSNSCRILTWSGHSTRFSLFTGW